MDKEEYEVVRGASKSLFDNALVLPVALAISSVAQERATFELGDLREELGGRAAETPIRRALKRIVSSGAATQLVSLGPPHSDVWERHPHPLWTFVGNWAEHLADGAVQPKESN